MESERGRVHLTIGGARVHTQQSQFLLLFFFCLCIPNLCGVKKMAFLSDFAERFQLSSNIVELLKEEAFHCETALFGLSEENIKEMEGLKLGERAALRGSSSEPTVQGWKEGGGGGGPLAPASPRPSAAPEDSGRGVMYDIAQRLEGLGIGAGQQEQYSR